MFSITTNDIILRDSIDNTDVLTKIFVLSKSDMLCCVGPSIGKQRISETKLERQENALIDIW